MKEESNVLGILAIVFSVLGGWIGLVLSIVGLVTYKEPSNRKLAKIGLIICIVEIALVFIIGIVVGIAAAGAQPY